MPHLNSRVRSALPDALQGTEPFDMKAFVLGRRALNPATGENVLSVEFSNDGIAVTLQDPTSLIVRTSTRYRHDGSHKHVALRSLRLIPVPPPKRQMRLEIVKLDGGGFSARCLGLIEDPSTPKQIGDRVFAGRRVGVTVYVHDFEVNA